MAEPKVNETKFAKIKPENNRFDLFLHDTAVSVCHTAIIFLL